MIYNGIYHKIWPYMVQYLHFRILKFPLILWCWLFWWYFTIIVCHVMVIHLWYFIWDSTWFEMYVCDTMSINCEYTQRIWISQKQNDNEWLFDKWFACSSLLSTSMTSMMFRIDACQNCWSENIDLWNRFGQAKSTWILFKQIFMMVGSSHSW